MREVGGHVTAFFLHEAAEAIDLSAVTSLIGGTSRVRLTPKTTTPSYVQYEQPPLTIEGAAIGLPDALGFAVRFKLFDYGVISVALTRALPTRGAIGEQRDRAGRTIRVSVTTCRVAVPRPHDEARLAMTSPRDRSRCRGLHRLLGHSTRESSDRRRASSSGMVTTSFACCAGSRRR